MQILAGYYNLFFSLFKRKIIINNILFIAKFPFVKFIKSISTTCVPNYPDKNLPTIFVYHENVLKNQIIGPLAFNGMNLKQDDFEWKLHRLGVLKSSLNRDINSDFEKNERINDCEDRMIKTIKQSILKNSNDSDEEY